MGKVALTPVKRKGGEMRTMMHRALRLVEEDHRQGCCHPTGGKDDKDDVRRQTPSRADDRLAATMNNR